MKILLQILLVLTSGFCSMLVVADDSISYPLRSEYDVCHPDTGDTYPPLVYLPTVGSSTEVYINMSQSQASRLTSCALYFNTCPNCYLKVNASSTFDYTACFRRLVSNNNFEDDDACSSDGTNFYIYDVDYKNQTTRTVVKDSDVSGYFSISSQLQIAFCNVICNREVNMRLRITSLEKTELLKQSLYPTSADQYFNSPNFPSPYIKNEEFYKYEIQSQTKLQVIVISFDDWWITYKSFLEFQGARNIDNITGAFSRPFIISSGQNMTVKFYTGEAAPSSSSYLGFRAVVKFFSIYSTIITPRMDCDRLESSDGGIINFVPMEETFYDCMWIIKKPQDSKGVVMKVIDLKMTYSRYLIDKSFEIHAGLTSRSDVIMSANPNDPVTDSSTFMSSVGFYIRFRGEFKSGDNIMLSYAMFIYDCRSYRNYFKCGNDLCISSALKCDGYDNCGDNSDELTSICDSKASKASSDSPISIGIIIPLVVSVFLIIIMCLLIIFIRRCRRLSNTANRNRDRPPGVRQPQNRGRRHRRHRDVQMSVTLSSGEHPPTYDEVLQNTPIGYLNMAFTWSQHGAGLTQPPSYEEAVSPTTAQPNGGIIIAATTNNSSTTSTTPQQQTSSSTLATTISASLDPRADVSSSSSSESILERYRGMDISSSSDSSTENENPTMTSNRNLQLSRSVTNLNITGKNTDNDTRSLSAFKFGSENNLRQVVFKTPSSEKLDAEVYEGARSENNRRKIDPVNSTANMNRHNETDSQDRRRSSGEVTAVPSGDRVIYSPHSLERRREVGRRNEDENFDSSRREGNGENDGGRREGREGRDHYRKHKGHRSEHAGREGAHMQGKSDYRKHDSGGMNKWPSKMADSSRSRSCVDLSWGGDVTGLSDTSRTGLRDEDKRFSYAGTGDMSLQRGSLDPLYNGRGLVRERPNEHLDRYASQSTDNLRDGYRSRQHGHQVYENYTSDRQGNENNYENYSSDRQGNENNYENYSSNRQGASTDQPTYYSRNQPRGQSGIFKPDTKSYGLTPVLENQSDEVHETAKLQATAPKYAHKSMRDEFDGFQDNSPENNLTERSNANTSSHYRPGASQMQSNSAPKSSSREARDTNSGHLYVKSATLPAVGQKNSSSQNYYADDGAKRSQDQIDNRKYHESNSRRPNSEARNDNQVSNISRNIASQLYSNDRANDHSPNPTDLLTSSSHGELVQEYDKTPQSKDLGRERTAARPKPTLRTHIHSPQRPERESPEAIPKPTRPSHLQITQKPTPAPRRGVKKRQEVDASVASMGSQNFLPENTSYADCTQPRSLSVPRYHDHASVQPRNHDQSSVQPRNRDQSSVQPRNHDLASVQPRNHDLASVQPRNHDLASVQPRNHDLASVQPRNHDQSSVQPRNHNLASVQPRNHDLASVQPRNHDLASVQPRNHDLASVQPRNHASVQPRNHSSVQPRNHDQSSVQPRNHSEISRPGSQQARFSQDADRWTNNGKNSRGEESFSSHLSGQSSPGDKVQVQTTNDDVFV